jgi:hypothetical protein
MWYNDGGCVLAHPDSTNVVMTGGMTSDGYFGVSVSLDTGRTWNRFTLWTGYADVCFALAAAPSPSRTVYAAGRGSNTGKVFISTDLGRSWQRTTTAPPYEVVGLAVHPDDPATVLAAGASGLYRTTNSGTSWTLVNSALGFRAVQFISADDAAAGGDNGVFLSTDGGASWTDATANLEGGGVTRLDYVRGGSTALLAGTRTSACWLLDFGVGVDEAGGVRRTTRPGASIVRGNLVLDRWPAAGSGQPAVLLDVAGRKVMDLRTGANNVGSLSPGVYLILQLATDGVPSAARRIVVE